MLALALAGIWVIVAPRTPDLAAQAYRVNLFAHSGWQVWDGRWYAGHHLPGYSLLLGPLASLVGLRLLALVSVVASATLFERLALRFYGAPGRWGAMWFAVAAVGDVWIGRVTFAVGVALALAAVLAAVERRPYVAAVLAALAAAASPVAGALLGLAALTHSLTNAHSGSHAGSAQAGRPLWAVIVLAVPAAAVVMALALVFPEGGTEPFPATSFAVTVALTLAFLWALPPGQPLLRNGAIVFVLACVVCLAIPSPIGSNVERYAVLLAGPLLVCALGARARATGPRSSGAGARRLARGLASSTRHLQMAGAAIVLCAIAAWVAWGPVRETLAVAGQEATGASYYAPVERFLATRAGPVRIEVPLTRSHWEAALLAPNVSLARGWEKQLEERFDGVLLDPGLSAAAYARWLHEQAVAYVALPDATLDSSSAREGRLIRGGLSYLSEVFASAHWRIYAVDAPTPIAAGPGRLVSLGPDSFALRADSPGSFLVRVHFSRYLTVTQGSACVSQAPGGWTSVTVRAAGEVKLIARFSLARALGGSGACGAFTGVARPHRGTVAPAPSAGFRWLVPTDGAPPSVAVENRAHGTSAWRLPGASASLLGGAAHGAVEGYVAEQAVVAGQTERVFVNAARARTVTVQVFRIGWYGGTGGRLVLQSRPLAVGRQRPCAHSAITGLTECRWRPTLSFQIPAPLASGVYVVKLSASDGARRDCVFVVRVAHPAPLLVEIPTATYEAYNAWGGDSLYPGGRRVEATGTGQGVAVSYDRPYDSQTGAGQFFVREVAAVRFLERYGYPVSYTTSEAIDRAPGQVAGARAVIDVGHSEYWSAREERAFAHARDSGTSLIFVSSDTLAWRVRFAAATRASSEAGAPDHVIIAYKEHAARDPVRGVPTGLFPAGGAALTGSAYDGCITPRVRQPGPPVYRYFAWSPTPSLQPGWLFAGTGVSVSTRIPGIVGYELDERTAATPAGTRLIGTGTAGASCQSAGEPAPARGTAAETTLYTARSGALVFATGTLGWVYGLSPVPQASPDAPRAPDPRVVAITRNLLARVLR